jgi:hypothetical protein
MKPSRSSSREKPTPSRPESDEKRAAHIWKHLKDEEESGNLRYVSEEHTQPGRESGTKPTED